MYSDKLKKLFKEKGIDTGDRITVRKDDAAHEGLLMPRPETGSSDCIVLKLDNGYNVGIEYDGDTEVEVSESQGPEDIRREADYELGTPHEDVFEFDEDKPPVSMVVTGGTISSKVDYETGGVTALAEPKELLHVSPELSDFVNVTEVSSPFTRMSENMNFTDYKKLAKEVADQLEDNDGVIVTHGTDTLHYTAAALSFALDTDKPVVLTGAQRSTDRGSTDASLNLLCSAIAATSDIGEVGICMHGGLSDDHCLFIRGTKARKMHTSRRDTFRPINEHPLARIHPDGDVEELGGYEKRGDGKVEVDADFYGKVALLKSYPGSDPEVIDRYVSEGYRGIVVEATGLGQVPTMGSRSWLPAIEDAIESDVTVVFAPQTLYGRLNPNVYSGARRAKDLGVIYARDMLPEVAYVKLSWVLGHTRSTRKAREMFLTNHAGEYNERREPDTFLR